MHIDISGFLFLWKLSYDDTSLKMEIKSNPINILAAKPIMLMDENSLWRVMLRKEDVK